MNDKIRKYKLRRLKRRIANRQDKREFDPSKHPRAEEGDVNAQGEKNGGQFVKKEETSAPEFEHAQKYKRRNLGKKSISYNDYRKKIYDSAQEAKLALSAAVRPSTMKSIDLSYRLGYVMKFLKPNVTLNLYTTEKGKRKKNIIYSFYKDKMGDIRFVHPDGKEEIIDRRSQSEDINSIVAPALFKFYSTHKDDYRPKVSAELNDSGIKEDYEDEYGESEQYGGYYYENNGGENVENFSPNPSVLCMLSPPILSHLEGSFEYIESEANRHMLSYALSESVISDEYTKTSDRFSCFYTPSSKKITLSEECARCTKGDTVGSAGIVAHEAAHSYDFNIGRDFDDTLSKLYNNGEFLSSTRKDVGDFLSKYGYTETMSPDEYTSIRETIIRDLTESGFTHDSMKEFSDMLDAYTNGKLNLGWGHSGYIGFKWDKDSFAQESYANQTGALERVLSRQLLEQVTPNATRTYDKMNSDMDEWKKNPMSKYIPLPLSLTGYTMDSRTLKQINDGMESIDRINKSSDTDSSKLSQIDDVMSLTLQKLPFGISLDFIGTNPKTGEKDKLKLLKYKSGYTSKFVLFDGNSNPIEDSLSVYGTTDDDHTILDVMKRVVLNNSNFSKSVKATAL